jgi:hypothetical protein
MADPLSMLAVLGLVLAGTKLSENARQKREPVKSNENITKLMSADDYMGVQEEQQIVSINDIGKQEHGNFAVIAPMKYAAGEPVQDFRDRPYVSGKMNNLSPAGKIMVGPGLGVGPETPAYGGYQQLYRVNPENVGAYRLTTLPGRSGPAESFVKTSGMVGALTHNKPETTAFLPGRLPNVPGRGQGQGGGLNGVTVRARHEHTKRPTIRSETGLRNDGLSYAPAKRIVSALQVAQDPTRNKSDDSGCVRLHNNLPQPGIHSFHGAYTNTPEVLYGSSAIRAHDKRSSANRMGNAGRMNVRESAINTVGRLTAVGADTSRMDGWNGPANDARGQRYAGIQHQNNNVYKGNANPNVSSAGLNLARNQLANNPLAHSISG